MMIAAAHLREGDLPVAVPPSDETDFDSRYRGPRGPEHIFSNTPRRSDVDTRRANRVITFVGGSYRCWENTHLIEIAPRA